MEVTKNKFANYFIMLDKSTDFFFHQIFAVHILRTLRYKAEGVFAME